MCWRMILLLLFNVDMPIRTVMPGDERITASDAKEFVHELRTGSWMDSNCTDEQYMCNFAERYVIQAGVRIATDTPENFLADLIRTGYAKEM